MVKPERTQVAVIGAGPAGLLLSRLLHLEGVETVVLERRSRAYVEGRIRAGVLESSTADLLDRAGVGARMRREGLVHEGIALGFRGRCHRIDFRALVGGEVVVYGQTEITRDLNEACLGAGADIRFETEAVEILEADSDRPRVRFRSADGGGEIACDFVAGCDGFHGIARAAIPPSSLRTFERTVPFGWFGILARTPPVSDELIYVRHERGFALFSMRSPELSRLYLQCPAGSDMETWPEERIWGELRLRLGGEEAGRLAPGPVVEKGIAPIRSFVAEPMRFGRLFLAGDAAHIVPPTGAKGLNAAAADVEVLARALAAFYARGDSGLLDSYSETCLERIWRVQRFSWWMTSLLHRFPDEGAFGERLRDAELAALLASPAASAALAENYVGLASASISTGPSR